MQIEKEYQKDPKLSKDDVRSLMEWIDEQSHLPKTTEFQALTFLHSSYYDLTAAKMTAEHYFSLRTIHEYLFDPITDENVIKDALSTLFVKVLPQKTPDDCIVFMMRIIDTRPSKYTPLYAKKIADMVLMSHLYKSGICNGLIIVYDMAGCSFKHMLKDTANLRSLKHFATYYENGFPLRLKQVHFVNTSAVTNAIINLVRPFLKKTILDMLVCHGGDNKTIYDYIAADILPKEITGTGKSVVELQEGQVENLIDSSDLFLWLQNQKTSHVT